MKNIPLFLIVLHCLQMTLNTFFLYPNEFVIYPHDMMGTSFCHICLLFYLFKFKISFHAVLITKGDRSRSEGQSVIITGQIISAEIKAICREFYSIYHNLAVLFYTHRQANNHQCTQGQLNTSIYASLPTHAHQHRHT